MDGAVESAAQAWARCRPYIETALEPGDGRYEIADVEAGIEAGQFHFWAGERCAAVTEFWTAPRLKTLNFWLLGGDLRELLKMRPDIEAWAIGQGCARAMGGSQKTAWARVLKSAGYQPRWTVFAKDLIA